MVTVQPFLLSLLPSPLGDQIALVQAWYRAGIGVSIILQSDEGKRVEEIATFEILQPVTMSWDLRGNRLAFAQGDNYAIWEDQRLIMRKSQSVVRKLGFDRSDNLWGISNDFLWKASLKDGFLPRIQMDGVVSVCMSSVFAVVRRRGNSLEIVSNQKEGSVYIEWPLLVHSRPIVRASDDGGSLFVSAQDVSGQGRIHFEIARIDLASRTAVRFFVGTLATGVGWPGPYWLPWTGDSVLLVSELDDYARVYMLDVHSKRVIPVSPSGFEVSAFAGSARSNRLAITGRPIVNDGFPGDNWLVLCPNCDENDSDWMVVRRGVNMMPAWDYAGRKLFYAHSISTFASEVCVDTEISPGSYKLNEEIHNLRCSNDVQINMQTLPDLELPGPGGRLAALLYVQGPHRRFVNGPQTVFFHHALLSMLGEFAATGYTIACLNVPGSSGQGRAYREPANSWLTASKEALTTKTQSLLDLGFERIGIVAGSLGALPALHYLAEHTLAVAVLISPVYRPGILALKDWQYLFGEVPTSIGPEELAHKIRTPLLILHGLRDEITAAGQSSRFVAHLPTEVPCDYVTFPDEGHIFSQRSTWETTLNVSSQFLRYHLATE